MSQREVRLSWEQRQGKGRNTEGRAEVAVGRVGNAAGGDRQSGSRS